MTPPAKTKDTPLQAPKDHATGATTVGGAPVPEPSAVPPVNEVQQLTITGATAGNFALAQDGNPTPAIPEGCTATQLQAALVQSAGIGPNNVTVTGTNPYTITYVNGKGGMDMTQLTVYSDNLVPPSATIQIQTITNGDPGLVGNPQQDAINAAYQVLSIIWRHGPYDWPKYEAQIKLALNLLGPLQTIGGGYSG
jgi:hypothetical protein